MGRSSDARQLPRRSRRALLTGGMLAGVAVIGGLFLFAAMRDRAPEPVNLRSGALESNATDSASCRRCRKPSRRLPWNYQLQGKVRVSHGAAIYDIDAFDTHSSVVKRIHRAGGYAICYVNAGAWENWRPDAGKFPESMLGDTNGWPGERYLDIRQVDVLMPLMRERFKRCRKQRFDAVEPDNVDAYQAKTGFAIGADDQLRYNRALAGLAHSLKLAVGLKNDLDQAPELAGTFDFAVVEQCVQYDECALAKPFTKRRKAVLDVEYSGSMSRLCESARHHRFTGLMQTEALEKRGRHCR